MTNTRASWSAAPRTTAIRLLWRGRFLRKHIADQPKPLRMPNLGVV